MKNKLNLLFVLTLIVFAALGCGLVERVHKTATGDGQTSQPTVSDSNKSLADKTIEEIADGETTGVSECDDVIKIFADQSKSPDDNWMTKATRDYVIGQIKKSFRESLEQNKGDKKKMAEQCGDYKKQLEKHLKAEQEKQN